jgi:hypothetical protein
MIFENEEFIDDNLLDLVKRMKRVAKANPELIWVKDRQVWVATLKEWVSEPVSVCYNWIDKNKFECFTEGRVFGSFRTAKEAVDSLSLLRFMENGVSHKVIEYLASKTKFCSMQKAVNSIMLETEIIITPTEMKILGIDESQRGRVHGRRFGI